MAALVNNVVTLEVYKSENNLPEKLDVFTSKSGKNYCVVDGNAVMLTADAKPGVPLFVVSMVDKDSGETWDFITATEPQAKTVAFSI